MILVNKIKNVIEPEKYLYSKSSDYIHNKNQGLIEI